MSAFLGELIAAIQVLKQLQRWVLGMLLLRLMQLRLLGLSILMPLT